MHTTHEVFLNKLAGIIRKGGLGLLLIWSWTAPGQPYIWVDSTTDGNGLFSYTFESASTNYVWGLSDGNGNIVLQSHGILDVISPPGWEATVNPDETISWTVSSGTVFVGEPALMFSVQSSFTGVASYDQLLGSGDPYQGGVIGGSLYSLPNHQGVALGFERFNYLGPQVIPEPSCLALLAVGVGLWVRQAGEGRGRLGPGICESKSSVKKMAAG